MCYVVSPTQVNVTWEQPTQPNGVIRHYEIVLQDLNTSENTTTFVNGQKTSATVNHLHPKHNYSCSVAAHTVARGSFSTAVYISLLQFRTYITDKKQAVAIIVMYRCSRTFHLF